MVGTIGALPPLHTLYNGVVKAVPSGDTIVVMKAGPSPSGPPPELRITLACVRSPQLSRDGQSDESYAWAAREHLRKRLISKTVSFRLEYKIESIGRVFGSVFLDQVNVAIDLVQAGLAVVKKSDEHQAPDLDALIAAEEFAVSKQMGIHSSKVASTVRNVSQATLDMDLFARTYREKVFKGIVEYVANGSALKVLLRNAQDPNDHSGTSADHLITVCLSGVQCPGFRKESEDPAAQAKPMPYALNAKWLTEVRLLHRDVEVRVEGADRNGLLFATVTEPDSSTYIGEELLRAGYAKTVSWSIELSNVAPALRAAERSARDRRAGVWRDFKPSAGNEELFVAKCIEVVSGDIIVVLPTDSDVPRRISLASVRAPRTEKPGRDRSVVTMGPAADAKEALRKKIIGRQLDVKIEYKRAAAEGAVRRDTMVFATVGRHNDAKNKDIALPLISDGLLSVVRHRGDEDRAENYEEYLEREKAAMEAKRGMHRGEIAIETVRVNNLTGPDAKKRSRDVLAGLQRNGPHEGVVEFVSNASRFRIFLPKQSMLITLALRAVRCPQSTRRSYNPDGSIREEVKGEPHGDDAANFARENFMQRNVEVEVTNVDRVGAFIGNMYLVSRSGDKVRQDVSTMLLEQGHGYMHESYDSDRDIAGSRYKAAQAIARDAKRGIWLDYVEAEETPTSNGQAPAEQKIVASVCEIGYGGRIFVQSKTSAAADLAAIEAGLAGMDLDSQATSPLSGYKIGQVVAAKFNVDENWYRAKILSILPDGDVSVRFMDYGNEDIVGASDIRMLNGAAGFIGKRAVAKELRLADIVVPDKDDSSGMAAGTFLKEHIYGVDIQVVIKSTEPSGVIVGDILVPTSNVGAASSSSTVPSAPASITELLLRAGLARIVRKTDRASRATFKKLRPFEEEGIATRQYMWSYGDVYESDCDDDADMQERNRLRRGGP